MERYKFLVWSWMCQILLIFRSILGIIKIIWEVDLNGFVESLMLIMPCAQAGFVCQLDTIAIREEGVSVEGMPP